VVLSRQRPATAKGTIFLSIEDESGVANVVVRTAVWQRCGPQDRRAAVLLVEGRVQRRGTVVHLLATRLSSCQSLAESSADVADSQPLAAGLPQMSRDFC
jgi:error-prone DNA polymerase